MGLGKEERTRVRKQKKKRKKKKLIVAKSGLVGMKENFKTYYNSAKYFLPFFNKTTFYTKLSRWFSGPKTKFARLSLKLRAS